MTDFQMIVISITLQISNVLIWIYVMNDRENQISAGGILVSLPIAFLMNTINMATLRLIGAAMAIVFLKEKGTPLYSFDTEVALTISLAVVFGGFKTWRMLYGYSRLQTYGIYGLMLALSFIFELK